MGMCANPDLCRRLWFVYRAGDSTSTTGVGRMGTIYWDASDPPATSVADMIMDTRQCVHIASILRIIGHTRGYLPPSDDSNIRILPDWLRTLVEESGNDAYYFTLVTHSNILHLRVRIKHIELEI